MIKTTNQPIFCLENQNTDGCIYLWPANGAEINSFNTCTLEQCFRPCFFLQVTCWKKSCSRIFPKAIGEANTIPTMDFLCVVLFLVMQSFEQVMSFWQHVAFVKWCSNHEGVIPLKKRCFGGAIKGNMFKQGKIRWTNAAICTDSPKRHHSLKLLILHLKTSF